MKILCNLLMMLTALPMAFVGVMSLIRFPKTDYDLRLVVGAIIFSGAVVGRCILEAKCSGNRTSRPIPPTTEGPQDTWWRTDQP